MNKVSSLSKLTPDATLSEIVAVDRKAGELLASIGLNPDNHKNQTLRSVCQQRQWSEVEVLRWVKKQRSLLNGKRSEMKQKEADFGDDLSRWCEYLVDAFHSKNVELLTEIENNFPRVHQIHGNQYPWLKNMQWHFERFDEALRMYYEFEEKKFYPLLLKLYNTKGELLHGTIRKLERCLGIVEKDQQRLSRFMRTLSDHGHGFKSPEGACSTLRIVNQDFRTLFNGLKKQFEIEKKFLLPIIREKNKVTS